MTNSTSVLRMPCLGEFVFRRCCHVFTGLLFFLLFAGCTTTHTTYLAEHWKEESQALYLVSRSRKVSRLQIIITYDGPLSSHSALRLESPNGLATFWDPAGAYGLVGYIKDQEGNRIDHYGTRDRDIVVTDIPDIPTYLNFRWLVGDSSVEVFEWDFPAQEIERLREVLEGGKRPANGHEEFQTETSAGFCSLAISDFLRRFVKPAINLQDSFLWPHNLAEALLEQSPSRIRIFMPDQHELVFTPPLKQLAGP